MSDEPAQPTRVAPPGGAPPSATHGAGMASAADATRSEAIAAGRGVIFIAGAKAYFMLAGFALTVALPHLLSKALFGLYGLVVGAVSVVNNVVVTGTVQAVSKLTSERDEHAGIVKAGAFRVMAVVGGGLALGFALLSPQIAAFERDAALTGPLRVAAPIIAAYALYSVLVGSANGLRRFHVQAGLDITYSTLRAGLIIGGAAVGGTVIAAVGGFLSAAVAILFVAIAVVGLPLRTGEGFSSRRFLGFAIQLAVYLVLLNLLMTVDLFLLKRHATGLHPGLPADRAAELASETAGLYFAAQNFARLPYQAIIAVTFVIFPLMSKATFEGDLERAKSYITTTLRYSLILVCAMAVVFVGVSEGALTLVLKPAYAAAAGPLAVLAVGYVGFALFSVASAIINGAGRPWVSVAFCLLGVLTSVGSITLIGTLPASRSEPRLLLLVALGSATAMLLALVASLVYLRARFGGGVPAATWLRVIGSAACAAAFVRVLPLHGKLFSVAKLLLCAGTYAVLLVLLRELGKADLAAVLKVVRRRPAAGGGDR